MASEESVKNENTPHELGIIPNKSLLSNLHTLLGNGAVSSVLVSRLHRTLSLRPDKSVIYKKVAVEVRLLRADY